MKITNYFKKVFAAFNKPAPERTGLEKGDSFASKVTKTLQAILSSLNIRTGTDFESSNWNFEEIRNAIHTDSYIKIALQKQYQLLFKSGYRLVSENENAITYLNQRFRLMSHCSGTPFDILLQEVGVDLTYYSNAFLFKQRVEPSALGVKAVGPDGKNPVGAYFRMDPATVTIKRDVHGNIKKYKQDAGGKEKQFNPEDIIHIYLDREADSPYGTPRIVSALEDVKLLRRMEGLVLDLTYRFARPMHHVKVGLTTPGMQGTDKEIEEVTRTINTLPPDGVLVTGERVSIETVNNAVSINIEPYLKYLERRVFSALNSSESSMGRDSTSSNIDSMEAQQYSDAKYKQHILSIMIENYIINELLLEGGFNPIIDEQDIVKFVFNEINNDTKVKMENHEVLKYQSNVITFEELRRNLGLKAESADISHLYANIIQQANEIEQINLQHKHAMELADLNAKNAAAASTGDDDDSDNNDDGGYTKKNTGNGKNTSTGNPNGQATTANRPTNQHGTTSAKVKEDSEIFTEIVKIYEELRNNVIENKGKSQTPYKNFRKNSNEILERYGKVKEYHYLIESLINDLKKKNKEEKDVNAVFEAFKHRLFLLNGDK